MIKLTVLLILFSLLNFYSQENHPQLSVTIDDPNIESTGSMKWMQKDDAILNTLIPW